MASFPIPPAPEYASETAWACLPGNPAHPELAADVIYAPGTLLQGQGPCYYDVYNPEHRALAALPRAMQASLCAGTANIFQPHCRQVSMEVNVLPPDQVVAAYQLSYADMRAAFLHYLEHWNKGRPFLLMGNSQGAILLLELLKDVLADPALLSRLIAAYIIGYSVTAHDLAAHPGMRLVEGELDSGGIITYNTLAKDASSGLTLLPGALCVNPLNWKTTPEYADTSLHLGRVDFDIQGRITRETPQFTDAWIDPHLGALKIGALASTDVDTGSYFPPGDFHSFNFAFFYRNLEQNIQRRTAHYMQKTS